MSDKITVFFTGATGYIGGAFLQHLLKDPQFSITVSVRNKEKAKKLEEQFGVTAIVGSLKDTALLEKEASEADIVLTIVGVLHM